MQFKVVDNILCGVQEQIKNNFVRRRQNAPEEDTDTALQNAASLTAIDFTQ